MTPTPTQTQTPTPTPTQTQTQTQTQTHTAATASVVPPLSLQQQRHSICHSMSLPPSPFDSQTVTLDYGLNDATYEMLDDESNSTKFMEWLDSKGVDHPETGPLLPLLKAYKAAKNETWEETSREHMLSFLLGSWEQRVYWFEVGRVVWKQQALFAINFSTEHATMS